MLVWLQNLNPPVNLTSSSYLAYVLFDVFLIIFLARLVGNLMVRIGQPRVVGEILAGILLGPTLLGDNLSQVVTPVEVRPALGALATLGLINFMFLAGLEFEVSRVRDKVRSAVVIAALAVAIPGLLGFPLGSILRSEIYSTAELLPFALFLGSALSVTAFPVMAHILMERGELNSPLGGLGVAIAGVISVLMFGYIAFAGTLAAGEGLGSFIANGIFVALFILGAVFFVRPLLRRLLSAQGEGGKIDGTGVAVIFGGMLVFGLLGHILKIHAMVGGFLWGLILPLTFEQRHEISLKIRDLAMIAFLPIFFAMSGFSTDLKLLTPAQLPAIGLILAAAVAGKFSAAAIGRSFGLSWSDVGKLGALLNTRGLLVLVAGLIGLQLQIITTLTYTIIVIVALVTNLMTLPLLNLFSKTREAAVVQEQPASPAD
jgi:Kef-type K+ transport system membrane component KefB